MADAGWQRKFEDPIPLPNGKKHTLRAAADPITSLPKKETDLPDWQVAMEALMLVSRSGPTMLARFPIMMALTVMSCGCSIPSAKISAGGKRKLKRDQWPPALARPCDPTGQYRHNQPQPKSQLTIWNKRQSLGLSPVFSHCADARGI